MNDATAPTVALVAIARPTFDVPLAQSVADAAAACIRDAGFVLAGSGAELIMDAAGVEAVKAGLAAAEFDLLLLLQASFADSTMAVQLAELAYERHVPILLWAVPDVRDGGRLRLNSLCGINLAGHALTRRHIAYDYLLAPIADEGGMQKLAVLARAGLARRRLQAAVLGVVGRHPDGFDTCEYDAAALQRLFGVTVEALDLAELLAAAKMAGRGSRLAFLERVRRHAANLDEFDAAATSGTAGVYVALQQQVAARRLAGVAVRCWPEFFTELGCAACGAMSVLNEDGCPASCEADVNGTLTSLLLQSLSGGPAFITDLVSIEAESDSGVFWHCGLAPFAMADPQVGVRAALHSNRKLPLLFEFPLKPGRVTIARLHHTADDGYQLAAGGGEMLAEPRSFGGTCGVVRFDSPATEVLDRIMRLGLEHHFSITYGDFAAELATFARLVGIPVLELTA